LEVLDRKTEPKTEQFAGSHSGRKTEPRINMYHARFMRLWMMTTIVWV
jgi:hypothetical protein